MECYIGYLLLGITAGILGATLGIGGGIIMVPVLVMLFHFPQKSAQGISLTAMILMSMVASLCYIFHSEIKVDLVAAGIIGVAAVCGALIGSTLVGHIPVGILRKIFAGVMIIAALKLAFTGAPPEKNRDSQPPLELNNQQTNGESQ